MSKNTKNVKGRARAKAYLGEATKATTGSPPDEVKRVIDDDGPGSSSRRLWADASTGSRHHADEVSTRNKRKTKKSLNSKLKKK